MAVKRSQNWLNQQRVDVPHLRSIESAVRNDFDELFSSFVIGSSKSYVIRGFDIEISGAIGAAANGLQLITENSAFLHGASNEAGTFFELPPGTPNQVLSATTNVRVEGAFTPGALNYVSLELVRQVDDSTTAQIYLWNPTNQNEITKTLPLAETLDYKIIISSSIFPSNVLPISIVETDASNNVLSIQDRRPMLFRLGTAGAATPDPFYEYPWSNHAEGREENFWQSSSSTTSPFRGGDKQILNFKENDEALKTELKQIKGTTYWYSPNDAGSLSSIRYDLGNTLFTGRGFIEHNNGNPGQINWNEDMFLTVVTTRLRYNLNANAATTDIDLEDNEVAYIKIIRDVDVIPQLVFTNGADEVTSVGSITWTTDLEAGDFVKIGSEGDEGYYEIASVDSASQVTLTENFGGTSTGVNGVDAKIAYGNYRTDPAPSTDRHIKVAPIEEVPFDKDIYWLFLRQDNAGIARVYVRFLNAELEAGEQLQISDQVPAALLDYIGSASDSDADPDYTSLATGAKTATENYNSTNGENLTVRTSKLTSMMADKAQDKTIDILSDHTSVSNTENAIDVTLQDITFSGGSGSATVAMPGSANNGTIGLSSTLELGVNQAAYFSVDRNAVFNLADLDSLTVSDIDSIALDENTFIFAYRLGTKTVYLWDNSVLAEGDSIALSVLRDYVQQNKTTKLVKGGTWSWDLVANELTNSESAFIQVAGLAENVNEIAAQSITLANDGECAYVTLKRSSGASVLTVNVADIASVTEDDHTFIIARRVNDDVIVGTNSFALKNRDYLELDGAKAEIDRRLEQLKANPAQPLSTRVVISSSDIEQLDGSLLGLDQGTLLLNFAGVQIDFETGEIFESDGVTPFLGGANDFTPFAIPSGEYFWYSISLIPSTTNADNTISGEIVVTPASNAGSAVDLATAKTSSSIPKANFTGSGIKIAGVIVQEDGAGGINNIDFENLIYLGVGGSGSGSGGNIKVNYFNPTSTSLPSGSTVTIDGQSGVDGDTVLFTNLSVPSENNKIYELSGVGTAISWEVVKAFKNGSESPEDGDSVRIKDGTAFAGQLAVLDNSEFTINDTVRYFNGADFWEQSSLQSASPLNNTTTNLFTVTAAGSENWVVKYSVVRGSQKESGVLYITHDNTETSIVRTATNIGGEIVGIDFNASLNSGDLELDIVLDNSGSDASVKFFTERWSDSSGGPSGIPSYSAGGGSSTTAAGSSEEVQFNSGGTLSANSRFKWSNAENAINLDGYYIGSLVGPITINDNQGSPGTLISVPHADFAHFVVEYSITRNGNKRTGRILVASDGSSVGFSDDFVESTSVGVTVSASVSGSNTVISYTSTSTGNTGEFKYSLKKWDS